LNVRECLELASANRVTPEQLYQFFATRLPRLIVLYNHGEAGETPFLARGNEPNSRFIVTFTDLEAARNVKVNEPEHVRMTEEPALSFLIKAYRSDAQGILFNPGLPSRLFLTKQHVLQMIQEYAAQQFSQMTGPWVPTMDQNMLMVEYQPESYTIAVYASEQDAEYVTRKSGGQPVQHPWSVIWDRCEELGTSSLFFHFSLPEQALLTSKHMETIRFGSQHGIIDESVVEHPFMIAFDSGSSQVAATPQEEVPPAEDHPLEPHSSQTVESRQEDVPLVDHLAPHTPMTPPIPEVTPKETESPQPVMPPQGAAQTQGSERPIDPDVAQGLKKLEKATIEGQGMGNGWEVCRAMAELRRIWVVVDPDGNMVILAGQDHSPIVDFFTSARHAERLIAEARQKNPHLPPMVPRLISTKKLYKALAPRTPIVWINRGSPEAWTSIMGDTLPYVLQLMSQLRNETI
jgi:hypothetical protein